MCTRMFFQAVFVVVVVVCFYCSTTVVNCIEFQVGGEQGWTIPNIRQEDRDFYNEWASKLRFNVNDTIRFKYEKDSVLVVTEAEYHKCKSTHPIFFSNNDDTIFTLNRSGLFYFISGVSGHCERGQKMIIKVLEEQQQQQQEQEEAANGRSSAPSPSSSVVPSNHSSGPSSVAVSSSSCGSVGEVGVMVGAMVVMVLRW